MKKFISIFLILIMLVLIFASCSTEKTTISVFFKNGQSSELSEEKRIVKAAEDGGAAELAKLAIAQLVKGPQNEKNSAVIDREAKLLSLVINDGVVTVNMSSHFAEKKGVDGLLLRFSFINTLCRIEGIDGIVIQVEGKPLVSENTGKEYGVLSMSDIALNTEDKVTLNLYFPDKDGANLVLEKRTVDAQMALSLEKTVVSELLKGPESGKLSPAIADGTKLLNIETKDRVCYVNFSSEFILKTSSGSAATMLTLYSVVNSLCSLESVESVQILVNGETGVEFGNFVLDIPYEANEHLIR